MQQLIRLSVEDFKKEYRKYLVFEYIYLLLTGFLFVPVLTNLFNRLLRAMGASTLLNGEVFRFILDVRSLIGLMLIGILAVILVFIEFGVVTVISHKAHFGQSTTLIGALLTVLRKIPRIFSFGVIQLILFFLFLIPFIDLPLSPILIGDLNVPAFVWRRIIASPISLALYLGGLVLLVYLFLRWIFTLHCILLEDKHTSAAIRESLRLTRKRSLKTLLRLVLLNILITGIGVALLSFLTLLPKLVYGVVPVRFVENYLITFSSLSAYMLTLLLTPLNIIFITRLYYRARAKLGHPETDDLQIKASPHLEGLEKRIDYFFRKRKRLLVLVLLVNLIAVFQFNVSVSEGVMHRGRAIQVIGHRADSIYAPENSLAAIRSAREQGVDMVEVDVQMTADGVLVLNHDLSLNRVAGRKESIQELSAAEATSVEIGSRFSEEFRGETIPSLRDALELIQGESRILLDVKAHGKDEEYAQALVTLIHEMDVQANVYIQSFNTEFLKQIRILDPELMIGQILYLAVGDIGALDVDFYAIEQEMLSNRVVRQIRQMERMLFVWTVNSEEQIREALRYDIDGLITNYPQRVRELIDLSWPLGDAEEEAEATEATEATEAMAYGD